MKTQTKSRSEFSVEPDQLEATLLDAALNLDQSKLPSDHVKARALRAFAVHALQFQVDEGRRGSKSSVVVQAVAEVMGNVIASFNATALGRNGERAPKGVEITGLAVMLLIMINSTPFEDHEILTRMVELMKEEANVAG